MPLDAKALADATADIVKSHVAAATAPLLRRIEALEAREPERGEKGERGDRGEQGPSGVGVAGAMIDRGGVLILTLSNGQHCELGPVTGKDGTPGEKGERGEPGEKGEAGERGEQGLQGPQGERGEKGEKGERGDAGPRGEVGEKGERGDRGFGLESFDVKALEDGRSIELCFDGGDIRHTYELQFPIAIWRGVFREGATYQFGDMVTWGGSVWHADKETGAKPDSPDSGWRLAVKKGRDGKDAPKA